MKKLLIFLVISGVLAAFLWATETHSGGVFTPSGHTESLHKAVIVDVNNFAETLDSIYGEVKRIVIDTAGTDTAFSVVLQDENLATIFTKADCNSVLEPLSYMVYQDDSEGNPWPDVPVGGAMTLTVSDANGLTAVSVTIYFKEYWAQ